MLESLTHTLSSPRVVRACFGPWLAGRRSSVSPGVNLAAARSILVVKPDGIGDFVLASPFLRELRKNAPQAFISLVVRPILAPFAQPCPHVDEVLGFDFGSLTMPHRRLRMLVKDLRFSSSTLRRRRYDIAVLPRWDFELWNAHCLMYVSGAAERVAYSETVSAIKRESNKDCDLLLTRALSEDVESLHEVERNLALIRAMGGSVASSDLEVWTRPGDEAGADRFAAAAGIAPGERLIAVAVGSWQPRKRWPEAAFRDLCRAVLVRRADRICFVGGAEDAALTARLTASVGSKAVDAGGRLTLGELACLMKRCLLFVGNDTGAKHVAAAQKVPVVEICAFPQGADERKGLSPKRFGAWGVKTIVVQPPCGGNAPNISGISVDAVQSAVEEMLR